MRSTLVLDTTVLSHFARAGRFDQLATLVVDHRCVMPAEVKAELQEGLDTYPRLSVAISASWIETVEVAEVNELTTFARYKAELGGGPRKNMGEAAVLAWVTINGGVAILDERPATRLARRDDLDARGSLFLVVQGFRAGLLQRSAAERLVDELRATDMRLPTDGAGLFAWAYREGLLD